MLQYPDFNKPFKLTTDASEHAVGAMLTQEKDEVDMPIAYFSNSWKQNYSKAEKEFLAVLYAVMNFRPYLYGREFISRPSVESALPLRNKGKPSVPRSSSLNPARTKPTAPPQPSTSARAIPKRRGRPRRTLLQKHPKKLTSPKGSRKQPTPTKVALVKDFRGEKELLRPLC